MKLPRPRLLSCSLVIGLLTLVLWYSSPLTLERAAEGTIGGVSYLDLCLKLESRFFFIKITSYT